MISNKTILLVEDEALIAMDEAAMLKKHGFTVFTAYNGKKAIELAGQENIDLILMDIDLGRGKMDGTEAAENILENKDIPIVFLSSHTEPEIVEKTEGITSYGYIVKNSGETVLLASIRMAFRLFEVKMRAKQHKDALFHSHDLMSYIIEHNQSAIAVHDKDLNYIYVSKQYLNQYNVRKRDVIGRHHYEAFPDLPQKWRDVHQKALLGEVSRGEDDPYQRDDGTTDWTRWECRPWYDADGSIGGIIVYTEVVSKERRINQGIRDNINYVQSILSTTRDGFWVVDLNGNFIDVNNAYCNMSGYSRDEILQLRIPDIDVDEKPEETKKRVRRVISTGSEVFEVRHRRKDGSIFDVEISASFLGGEKDKILCFCRDITERKIAEEELKKSEKKYRLLFNYSNDAIFVHEIGKDKLPIKNIEVNEQATRLLCYSREELLNMSAKDVVPEKHASTMHMHAKELIEKKHLTFETENIRSDGIVIPIEVSAYLYTEGTKKFVVSNVRDISKRKQAEKALAQKAKLLEDAQELANFGSWEWDIVHDTWYFSEQWRKIHGVSDNDLTTSKLIEIAHPEDAPYIEKAFSDAKEQGKTYDIEHRIIRTDNKEIRYIKALGEVKFDQDTGSPVRMVGSAQDITESKKQEKAIRKALEEKNYLMKELNHRVKNNLNMVSSLISLKDSETEDDLSDLKHRIDVINLVHEKLHQNNDIELIDVTEYFQELLEAIFYSTGDRHVDIVNNIEEVSIRTKTAVPLGFVVNEIATNAIKYGFTSDKEARFTIEMKRDAENKHYVIKLSNTGNPFPEDVGLENPQTMGLQLISTLVTQLNGTIELQKRPYPVFTIRFPIEEEAVL